LAFPRNRLRAKKGSKQPDMAVREWSELDSSAAQQRPNTTARRSTNVAPSSPPSRSADPLPIAHVQLVSDPAPQNQSASRKSYAQAAQPYQMLAARTVHQLSPLPPVTVASSRSVIMAPSDAQPCFTLQLNSEQLRDYEQWRLTRPHTSQA